LVGRDSVGFLLDIFGGIVVRFGEDELNEVWSREMGFCFMPCSELGRRKWDWLIG
jgi:hypothetical protein